MDAKQIAAEHVAKAADGLDLTDLHERTLFRQRMIEGMGMTRRDFIVDMAHAMGATDVPRNAGRGQAIRAIARAHLAGISA